MKDYTVKFRVSTEAQYKGNEVNSTDYRYEEVEAEDKDEAIELIKQYIIDNADYSEIAENGDIIALDDDGNFYEAFDLFTAQAKYWYAVTRDSEDDLGNGSEDKDEAVKILLSDFRYNMIFVVENDECVEEISKMYYKDVDEWNTVELISGYNAFKYRKEGKDIANEITRRAGLADEWFVLDKHNDDAVEDIIDRAFEILTKTED